MSSWSPVHIELMIEGKKKCNMFYCFGKNLDWVAPSVTESSYANSTHLQNPTLCQPSTLHFRNFWKIIKVFFSHNLKYLKSGKAWNKKTKQQNLSCLRKFKTFTSTVWGYIQRFNFLTLIVSLPGTCITRLLSHDYCFPPWHQARGLRSCSGCLKGSLFLWSVQTWLLKCSFCTYLLAHLSHRICHFSPRLWWSYSDAPAF